MKPIDVPGYPLPGKVSLPRMVLAQFDSITYSKGLNVFGGIFIREMETLMARNHKKYWFTTYISLFVLLSEASWITRDRYRHARQLYGPTVSVAFNSKNPGADAVQVRYTIPQFVEELQEGCNIMLMHWHYYNCRPYPDPDKPQEKQKSFLADLEPMQYNLVMETIRRPEIQRHLEIFKNERENNGEVSSPSSPKEKDPSRDYGGSQDIMDWDEPFYWVSQMFEEDWRPHRTYMREKEPRRESQHNYQERWKEEDDGDEDEEEDTEGEIEDTEDEAEDTEDQAEDAEDEVEDIEAKVKYAQGGEEALKEELEYAPGEENTEEEEDESENESEDEVFGEMEIETEDEMVENTKKGIEGKVERRIGEDGEEEEKGVHQDVAKEEESPTEAEVKCEEVAMAEGDSEDDDSEESESDSSSEADEKTDAELTKTSPIAVKGEFSKRLESHNGVHYAKRSEVKGSFPWYEREVDDPSGTIRLPSPADLKRLVARSQGGGPLLLPKREDDQ